MKSGSTLLVLLLVFAFTPTAGAADDIAAVYKSKCSPCHGPDGAGATAMGKKLGVKSLSSPEVQKLTDAQILETILKGKGKMPPNDKKITVEQAKALVGHVRSFGKK